MAREDKMKTRSAVVAAALVVSVALSGTAWAETLKVSTFVPPNHAFNKMLTSWGEELAERSGGKLTIELFPSGQLGPAPRQFDLATSGAADVSLVLHAATPGRFPLTELAALPLTEPSVGIDSKATSRRLTEISSEYLAEEHGGTKILWMAVTPPLKIHLTDTRPDSIEAFEGLRIRYAGSTWKRIVETLGASPVAVPPPKTGDAMSKGTVDGACFPHEAAKSFDLAPMMKYSFEPGLSSATFAVVMSQETYDGLPGDMQALIDETTGPDRAAAFGALWDEGEKEGRAYLVESGIEIVSLPDDEMAKLFTLLEPIKTEAIERVDAMGLPGQTFFDAYTK